MNYERNNLPRLTEEIQDMQVIVATTEYDLQGLLENGLEQEIYLLNLAFQDDVEQLNQLKDHYQQITGQEYTSEDF